MAEIRIEGTGPRMTGPSNDEPMMREVLEVLGTERKIIDEIRRNN
jgi:hypothetical protein